MPRFPHMCANLSFQATPSPVLVTDWGSKARPQAYRYSMEGYYASQMRVQSDVSCTGCQFWRTEEANA